MSMKKAGVCLWRCYLYNWRRKLCGRRIWQALNRDDNLCTGSGRLSIFIKQVEYRHSRSFEIKLIKNFKAVLCHFHSHAFMFDQLQFF